MKPDVVCVNCGLPNEDNICVLFVNRLFGEWFLEGYIFVNCEPLLLWDIAKDALKIEGVNMAHAVTGQFDVVAYVEFVNMDKLREILGKFQSLKGVQRTQTAVAIPPRIK